jgi:flagellar FliL protein
MIIAALLLLGGGGAAVTMLGIVDLAGITGSDPSASQDEGEEEKEKELPDEMVYYDLPEFLVNLNTAGKQTSFLKMTVTVELPKLETMSRIDSQMPRIVDSFNTYLRELRSSDLTGSAGTYRLREELLIRVNKILYPDQVTDILFKEILVQ